MLKLLLNRSCICAVGGVVGGILWCCQLKRLLSFLTSAAAQTPHCTILTAYGQYRAMTYSRGHHVLSAGVAGGAVCRAHSCHHCECQRRAAAPVPHRPIPHGDQRAGVSAFYTRFLAQLLACLYSNGVSGLAWCMQIEAFVGAI